ncbi:MAG: CRISPR-associated Csh2 family protein [bacterium]|nr:MAG: CRISPR-associated Csh2 family protein [bacterium]
MDLRIHQNTSVFSSTDDKKRGAIGTTTIVPYCINQIHGWINPYSAVHTDLTQEDINLMCEALWNSVNNANTRSKSNQNSLLLLQIVYQKPTDKLYGLDKLIKLISDKQGEQLRSSEDYTLDFSGINQATSVDKVLQVNFYTENQQWKEELEKIEKFSLMLLV